MNFKQAMCQAVVDGWHGDWKMSRVVGYSWALAEIEPDNEQEKYQVFADAAKVRWIHASDRAQVWIAKEMPRLNESLWAGGAHAKPALMLQHEYLVCAGTGRICKSASAPAMTGLIGKPLSEGLMLRRSPFRQK